MHRIDTDGAVAGLFNDGNPAIGQHATQVDSAWANAVQENIVEVVLAAGLSLVKGDHGQLLEALVAIIADAVATGGITLPVAVGQGGTGAISAAAARGNLGAAKSGDNTDISHLANGTLIKNAAGNGKNIGFRGIRINSQAAAYTCDAADEGGAIYHPHTDATARTYTIPAHATVPYPVETAISFINDAGAGTLTIDVAGGDTLIYIPGGTTGARSLAAAGIATAIKVANTRWVVFGQGLS